jgi:hypothetical protein
MSRVGRYERGTYVLCVRLGAGSAHGCAHCTMQRGNCMHAESPMRLRCVSPCGDAFDRRRSTSVDGARGELGSCLSLVHARSSALWVARAACVYPPLGGGGSMFGICIGVSLRVRPLRETESARCATSWLSLEKNGFTRVNCGIEAALCPACLPRGKYAAAALRPPLLSRL